jgi:hypothetical protein
MPNPITETINRRIETGSNYPASVTITTTGDINAGTHTFCGVTIDRCETAATAPVNEGRIAVGANAIENRARGFLGERG